MVKRLYTAFGELIELTGSSETRHGYGGAWGYQEHDVNADGTPDNEFGALPGALFPFLHVGESHYDPSTGRILQRDPIGIDGGLNVYDYVRGNPVTTLGPLGLNVWEPIAMDPMITEGLPGKRTKPKPPPPNQSLSASRGSSDRRLDQSVRNLTNPAS